MRLQVGVALTDITTGLYTQSAILAALYAVRVRFRSQARKAVSNATYALACVCMQAGGAGQHIDAALLDCCIAGLANVASGVLAADWPARPWGTAHESIVPYQVRWRRVRW